MTKQIAGDSEIITRDPENTHTYWQQCRKFDTRPMISIRQSQQISQTAFNKMLQRFKAQRQSKLVG